MTESWLARGLHLGVLCSLAVGQPLFQVFGRGAEFFIARDAPPIDIWLFAVAPTILLPTALLVVEGAVGLASRRLARGLHLALVGGLAALALVPPVKNGVHAPTVLLAGLVAACGAAAMVVYARWRPAQAFLTVLSPAPLIVAGMFLFGTPVAQLLDRDDEVPAADVDIRSAAPVVVLVLDELPTASLMDADGRIDPVLFPNFAALASESTWFRNYTTNNSHTSRVIPMILTGRFLETDTHLAVVELHPESLFTLLGGSYRMKVWEMVTRICPAQLVDEGLGAPTPLGGRLRSMAEDVGVVFAHLVVPQRWADALPGIADTWGDFVDDEANTSSADKVSTFRDFIASIDGGDEPTLYFHHLMLPHVPWIYLPSGRQYFPGHQIADGLTGRNRKRWLEHEGVTRLALQRHLLQLGMLDDLLGEMLARLRETNLHDRSLIVLLADHGASFEPGSRRRFADPDNARAIMHVPLLVKLPGQREARVDDRNVESIDVVPTIADALDVDLPWSVHGQSAFDDARPPRAVKTIQNPSDEPMLIEDVTLPASWPDLQRKLDVFGPRPSWSDIEVLPSRPALVGRAVEQVATAANVPASVWLLNEHRTASVDRSSGYVPAYVQGHVTMTGTAAPPAEVAIAVNGTVRTVVSTFGREGMRTSFAAMVPEDAFDDGSNEIRVLAVVDDARLAPMASVTYRFVAATPPRFERVGGGTREVVAGAVSGELESAVVARDHLVLSGWAGDLERELPATYVLVVVDGSDTVLVATTGIPHAGLEERHGRRHPLSKSGFRFDLPLELLGDPAEPRVRVFGVVGDRISELGSGSDGPP